MSECAPLHASSVPDVFLSSSTTPKAASVSVPVPRPALRSSQSHNGVFQAPSSWPRRAMTTIMNTSTGTSIVPSSFERTRPASTSTSTSTSGLPPSLGSMLAPPPPPQFAASAPGPTPTPVPRADPSVASVMGGVGGGDVSIVSSQHEASAPSTSTPSSSAPFATRTAPPTTYPPTSSSTSSSSSVPITQSTHTHNHNHTHSHSQYSTSYPPTSVGVSFPSYDNTPVHHQPQPQPQAQQQAASYPPYDPFASPHWQMPSQQHSPPALQPQHEPHGYMSYHHHQSYYPYPMPQTAIKQDEPILALGELPAPRPPMSYAALIGEALLMAPPPHQLYVSEISDSIKKRYAYYRQNPTKIYNGTSMCKAFVKLPRPFGDQSGGARKWAIRAGCENWFSNGGYHPPGSSPFSSPPSRPKSAGGKAKATATAKRLAIGTSTSSRHGLGGSIKSEPFSPSSSTGGPSVGPAFDGTTRPAWVAAPSPPQQYAQAPFMHPGYHYVPVSHSSGHPSAPGVYFWPHYSAASVGSDSNSSPVAAAGQITATGHVYPTPPITQPAASPGWSNARFELVRDTDSSQHGRSIDHQPPPSVAGSQGSYDDNQPVSPASMHDTHLSVHSQPSPDL
ncbi:hypothetical protein JCM24511_04925 [Saitozyma sp. JCM 24511]|nr:hypothetical protein JCM24511_04925 [Saitozyma sp. JCM 24511]